jgi:hypothetical protein
MCLLTIVLLVFPGTKLDSLWNLNPDARVAFQSLGSWSILLMLAVGIGCALTAIGLWRGTLWGIRLGLAILVVNIIGDLVNVITRHDYRSLIGLVIAGVMIFYLAAPRLGAELTEHYAAEIFSRAYRRARVIQTSSFRSFSTRPL